MAVADITLPPTAIKGTVTGPNATKVAMAKIQILRSGDQAFSDAQGNYLLAGVEIGNRTVLVSAQGFQSISQTIALGPAGVLQTLDFALTAS